MLTLQVYMEVVSRMSSKGQGGEIYRWDGLACQFIKGRVEITTANPQHCGFQFKKMAHWKLICQTVNCTPSLLTIDGDRREFKSWGLCIWTSVSSFSLCTMQVLHLPERSHDERSFLISPHDLVPCVNLVAYMGIRFVTVGGVPPKH